MRLERRTQGLLAVLGVSLAVALWMYGGGSGTTPAAGVATRTQAPAQAPAVAGQAPIDVHIDTLTAERAAPAGSGRNPFQFQSAAPPRTSDPGDAMTSGPGLFAPTVPPGPPAPAPIALKFIGLVEGAAGLRVAVLSDGRSPPIYGRQGDIIDGRYRIVSIGVESIELEYADGHGRQTIRLTGQ